MPEKTRRHLVCIVALLVSTATASLAAGDEIQQPPLLVVTGRVVDSEGKPIPGVKIWRLQTTEEQLQHADPPPVAISGPDGTFTLRGPQKSVVVGACPAGWTYAQKPAIPWRPQAQIELRLDRATRISGRVLDKSGEPVAGVTVRSTLEGRSGGCIRHGATPPCENSYEPRSRVTDADGRFVLESLKPGWFEISVDESEEGERQVVRRRGAPGRGIEGVEFILSRKSVPVEGRVVDADGAPVAGASVTLSRALPEPKTETDTSGEFRFSGVLSGKSHLKVEHPDQGWIEKDVEIEDRPVRLDLRMPPVTLVQGHVLGPDGMPVEQVFLKVGARYAEVASDGAFQLTVPPGEHEIVGESFEPRSMVRKKFTARGEPPVDLELRLVRPGTIKVRLTGLPPEEQGQIDLQDRPEGLRFSSEKDLYEIDEVPPGTWTLVASDSNGRTVERSVVLGEGETVTADTIDFPPLPAVRGRVLDPSGRPSAQASVTFQQGDREISAEADAAGNFVSWLREGRWTVRAQRKGFGPANATIELTGDAPAELPDLRLVPLVTVSGRVLGVPPEVAVPQVMAESEGGSAWSDVDQENHFHFPDLWPGTWTLSTDLDGRPVRATFEIPPGVAEFGIDLDCAKIEKDTNDEPR
ncbi:MAG TPA: carboxypeptidase-like regulatory domain-containing protein [Thermoanaerobaculia bacterium]|nr:carboxypeptidase-like regulatory domain-containing protein [Thermoanaerobaculia bacterium]